MLHDRISTARDHRILRSNPNAERPEVGLDVHCHWRAWLAANLACALCRGARHTPEEGYADLAGRMLWCQLFPVQLPLQPSVGPATA